MAEQLLNFGDVHTGIEADSFARGGLKEAAAPHLPRKFQEFAMSEKA